MELTARFLLLKNKIWRYKHLQNLYTGEVRLRAYIQQSRQTKQKRKENHQDKKKKPFYVQVELPAQPLSHIIIFINYFGLSIIVELLVLKMRAVFYNPFIIIYCIKKFMLDNTKTWYTLKHGIHFIFPNDIFF
jgi:hypothetical protein